MISGPIIDPKRASAVWGKAVFLDARAGPDAIASFEAGHVSGARFADLERDLSDVGDPSNGGRHPLPPLRRWLEQLGRWGIEPSTSVLVYDDANGGMAAARAWWMLRAAGHAYAAVVDGGWDALCEAGVPLETGPASSTEGPPYPTLVDAWPSVDATVVEHMRMDPQARLIDARAPERYAGEFEPIDPIAGHIPGAINVHWRSQLDAEGRLLDEATLRARYAEILGAVPPERVVCYCGSGVTACHLLLAMEASGLRGARLYVGSWSEWCRTREGATRPK